MNERLFFLAYKLPSLAIGALVIIVSLFLLLFIQGCIKTFNTQPHSAHASSETSTIYYSDNPSVLMASMEEATHAIGQDLSKAASVANGGLHHVAAIIIQGSKALASGAQATARGIGTGIMFMVNTTASIVIFILRIPINVFGFIADTKVAHAIIEPADHSEVPIIDPNDPELLAAQQVLSATQPEKSPGETHAEVAWPMRGSITTHFGEKGRFYRTVHTGIDISDGNRSGVTPINAFRSGKVIAVGRDGGLGNRVIVDHGNDITSVYAHLSSILVQVGQDVDTKTILGHQGSTGVSTGPHLHFEIRINNQVADPRLFLPGHP